MKEVHELSRKSIAYDILTFKLNLGEEYVPVNLYWYGTLNVLIEAGFAKRKVGNSLIFVQVNGGIISEVQPYDMKEFVHNYLDKYETGMNFSYELDDVEVPFNVIKEIFLKNSNTLFNKSWLEHLPLNDNPIIKDEEDKMYFPFKNGLVVVKRNNTYEFINWYKIRDFYVWDTQLINHEFTFVNDFKSCHFYQFLNNVTNGDEHRWQSLKTAIGYLLHFYYRESEGQAVIFYDEIVTDTKTPMGGTGKGIVMSAIKTLRNVAKIDGKHFKAENRFCWEKVSSSTQVVWLDDVRPNFDFSVLHSNLTDGWTVEAKHRSQIQILPNDSPKTSITSNSAIDNSGSTNKRRQFVIELSNYYSKMIKNGTEQPIKDHHGCIFFSKDWNINEWNSFFSLMISCAFEYLNYGLVYSSPINLEKNLLQKATDEDFVIWTHQQEFIMGKKYETSMLYKDYVESFGVEAQIGQRKFTMYLQAFAKFKNWNFQRVQSNGRTYFQFAKRF